MTATDYYLAATVLAMAFITGLVGWQMEKAKLRRKENRCDGFLSVTRRRGLTNQQKRLLTFGAIISLYSDGSVFGIAQDRMLYQHLLGHPRQARWPLYHPYFLGIGTESGIDSSTEAVETLKKLFSLEKSTEFEAFLSQPSPKLALFQKRIAGTLMLEVSIVEQTRSAYAWDVCRTVALAKWCCGHGYLTEKQAWKVMEEAAEVAIRHGKNWTDYTVSFFLGMAAQSEWLSDRFSKNREFVHEKAPSERWIRLIDMSHAGRELLCVEKPSSRRIWQSDMYYNRKKYATSTSLSSHEVQDLNVYKRFSFG